MTVCALVGATEFNETHFLRQRFDCIVAVDAGYASLRTIGCNPDVVVGDFDSLGYVPDAAGCVMRSDGETPSQTILRFPSEKDESDMELAIAVAQERGCDTILFYGALAARLDHTLANIQIMVGCARRGLRVFGIGRGFVLAVLDGGGANALDFNAFDPSMLDGGEQGRFFSLFAYGGKARGVVECGMKYPLDAETVPDDVSLGLSNEFTGNPVHVSLSAGNAVAVFPEGAWYSLVQAEE